MCTALKYFASACPAVSSQKFKRICLHLAQKKKTTTELAFLLEASVVCFHLHASIIPKMEIDFVSASQIKKSLQAQ